MSYSSSEIRSGFLIIFSLGLLFGLTFYVGGFKTGEKVTYQVRFGYVGGLEANAPVYFAGRESGKVAKMEILSGEERPILMTIEIPPTIRLRKDSHAHIDTLGLMGEKFVELTPGTMASEFVAPGATLQGTDPIPMHQMVSKMNMLADRMDEMTKSLNPLMEKINLLVGTHQEEISKTISNLHEISSNLRDMTSDLKRHPWKLIRKG